MRLLSFIILSVFISSVISFAFPPTKTQPKVDIRKKLAEEEERKKNNNEGWLRFVPDIVKARFVKSFETPRTDSGNRYQLRLVKPLQRGK